MEKAGGHGVPVALDETWHTWETELKLLAAACRTLGDAVVAAAGYREAESSLAGQPPGG